MGKLFWCEQNTNLRICCKTRARAMSSTRDTGRRRPPRSAKKKNRYSSSSSSSCFSFLSSFYRRRRVLVLLCALSVVCSKSARFYYTFFSSSSSTTTTIVSRDLDDDDGGVGVGDREVTNSAADDGNNEETEKVFGDLRESDLDTPMARMRREALQQREGDKDEIALRTTTTISKSVLEKMKDLRSMDVLSQRSKSSSGGGDSNNNNNRKKKQYETCALVGTAAIVTDAQRGGEIDANDAVFRTDDAPTKRYEQFVGRRATYRIVSGSGDGSSSSSRASASSFFEDIVSSGEAIKEKSIVTTTPTTVTSSSMEGESEDENAGSNGDESEEQKVTMKYTSPFAKYLVALDDVAKEKIRDALSLTDEGNDDDNTDDREGEQLTRAIALDASFAEAIREAYATAGKSLNDLGENFKVRQTPPVGAFALFFALSKCTRLSLYGFPSPDSNRLETQPYWPRKTKTDGKPTKVDVFGDRVFYALVRLLALEGFVDVVN